MRKNDIFIDISAFQNQNASVYPWHNTVIKVSESTSWLSPVRTTQAATSQPQGYYHYARFGGSISVAQAEADFFIAHLPSQKVKYLICDYESDASGSIQANTNAILAFMDKIKAAGYEPLLYSYVPYLAEHTFLRQIVDKYPRSIWIASYITTQLNTSYENKDYQNLAWNLANYGLTWVMPHIRWFQYSSTALAGGLDINAVLIGDETQITKKPETKKGNNLMFIYTLDEVSTIANFKFGKGAKFLVNPIKGETSYISSDTWNAHKESLSSLPQEKGHGADFTSFVALVGAGKITNIPKK